MSKEQPEESDSVFQLCNRGMSDKPETTGLSDATDKSDTPEASSQNNGREKAESASSANRSGGTANKGNAGLLLFSVVFIALCFAPFAGMVFVPQQTTSDSNTLSDPPTLIQPDGAVNLSVLAEAGDYFEDHFAWRNEALDANARLRVATLATSPTNQVIVGDDGWLYYGGTLADYQGTQPLSEREIINITHNLELMQGYTEAQGARFVLAIAPNKNTLYPQHMPYYLPYKNNDAIERLTHAFDDKDINYVDLFRLFEEQPEELYYKTDTHWTNEGAFLVSNELLQAAEKEAAQLKGSPQAAAIRGDLEHMLYPVTAGEEEATILQTGMWQYAGAASSVEDSTLETRGEGEGVLLMYRDSFANTLIPLMSPQFSEAHYSKLIPYNLSSIKDSKADVVIVERAERHLRLWAEDAPIMPAPSVSLQWKQELQSNSVLAWYRDEDYRVIEGWVDESCMTDQSQIFIAIEGPALSETVYVPFYTAIAKDLKYQTGTDDSTQDNQSGPTEDLVSSAEGEETTPFGFKLYLNEHSLTEGSYTLKVLVLDAETEVLQSVATQELLY